MRTEPLHSNVIRSSRFLLAPLVAGLVAVAAPAWGGVGQPTNEDFKLLANDGAAADWFGWSIAIDNGIVAVGVNKRDGKNPEAGAAYLFDASTGAAIATLEPEDGMPRDQFGWSIAIDNGVIAVGARLDDDLGSDSGSAYVFDLSCPVDLNGDGVVNTFDFIAFLNFFKAGDPIADWNSDGVVNTLDFLAYLNAFQAGC